MTRFERRRFTALVDDAVRPTPPLPRVDQTDALAAFEAWLRAAPLPARLVLRALVLLRHDVARRLAAHCYYGDRSVMRLLGYDADAVVARARVAR